MRRKTALTRLIIWNALAQKRIGERAISRRQTVAAFDSLVTEPNDGSRPLPAELANLYRRHWKDIRRYIQRRFGAGPPEPEDIVQAAFLRLSAKADLALVSNPRAFLYRAAHNMAIEERRRQDARSRAEAEMVPIEAAATDDRDPERVLSGKERRKLLEMAFSTLEPRTRQIVIMSRQDELSSAEIARRLGLSPTHVKRLIAEAIAHCRAVVEAELPPEGEP